MADDDALRGLLAEVGRGDAAALARLYDLTSPKLFGVILRIQKDRGLAEDVLQDVYLRVWQAAGSYDPATGRPLTWLCIIARNRAIDVLRRKDTAEVQGPSEDYGEDWVARLMDPHDDATAFMYRDALSTCLSQLEPMHRDCVVLAYCEGHSREELALRHNRPVNTIKTWLHRALASLRTCLETVA
ncbi:sigma-70 family RNA polymerase sigma factor [Methylobacterium sp. J-088]|uniref:sigma-70 family RNA polymerase sigma factor n=1 Tax=unclassified Methylobacterium TaxID=2615210 RepID=UPI001FBB66F9|nr:MULTISPECIES: sigma-70 family RNA polymerase sigma factor [unclassified Methylobacterium]MCJ2021288.1 sigma-70 family RNA polymerase sigma factor [Methylobacterium sp. E-065]MCJ2064367.1 sigma-70 family RNA polymerase sigma factor [Methylobacterium sp. J-088]